AVGAGGGRGGQEGAGRGGRGVGGAGEGEGEGWGRRAPGGSVGARLGERDRGGRLRAPAGLSGDQAAEAGADPGVEGEGLIGHYMVTPATRSVTGIAWVSGSSAASWRASAGVRVVRSPGGGAAITGSVVV